MSTNPSRFEQAKQRLREQGTLFFHTAAGADICGSCHFRNAFNDYCRRFKSSIRRINQGNGGFHHKPCLACKDHKITETDIMFLFRGKDNVNKS